MKIVYFDAFTHFQCIFHIMFIYFTCFFSMFLLYFTYFLLRKYMVSLLFVVLFSVCVCVLMCCFCLLFRLARASRSFQELPRAFRKNRKSKRQKTHDLLPTCDLLEGLAPVNLGTASRKLGRAALKSALVVPAAVPKVAI